MIDTCYLGDVRDGLRAFIAAGLRARTCVTSPPYWGLRDYGCEGQIGLEPTIAEYVATMVDVFRLVRDALANDGTLWLNLGDSYSSGNRETQVRDSLRDAASGKHANLNGIAARPACDKSLKPKDLCGIPWRVALALQEDGWYLRSDIIWAKPNPMPESVTDRPTKAHEYLFLLAKSERYYYDATAIAEPVTQSTVERLSQPTLDEQEGSYRVPGKTNGPMKAVGTPRNDGARWNGNDGRGFARKDQVSHAGAAIQSGLAGATNHHQEYPSRNKRSVWTVTTQPFKEAHFATFPIALVEPCVLAGSASGDIVLDPFMGSGTVAKVAQSLGRRWYGCELNPAYVAMQSRRAAQLGMELVA